MCVTFNKLGRSILKSDTSTYVRYRFPYRRGTKETFYFQEYSIPTVPILIIHVNMYLYRGQNTFGSREDKQVKQCIRNSEVKKPRHQNVTHFSVGISTGASGE